jgi:hypothetical protein
MTNIDRALLRLLALMQLEGAEFPDECWRVASAFGVDCAALTEAYDTHEWEAYEAYQAEQAERYENSVAAAYVARGQGNLY